MRILNPVVQVASHFPAIQIAQFAHCSGVGFQTVGNDSLDLAIPLQGFLHKAQCCGPIPLFRHITFEDLALVIHGTPKVMGLAIDLHVSFIKMAPPVSKASHPAHPLPPDVSSEQWSEAVPPVPYGFMAKVDTALEQQVFHIPQRQWKSDKHQHNKADHLG